MTMPQLTRPRTLALGLLAGILIGLALFDGCGRDEESTYETTSTTRVVDTVYVPQAPDTIRIPEAYAVVKWRDRSPVAQIDSSRGRRDTVLVAEPFAAEWRGLDSSNGGQAHGMIQFPPLRVTDLTIACPPDTSILIRDSVTVERLVERTIIDRPIVGITIGPFVGVDHELKLRYGAAISAGIILGSW